jgi:hypothetical protein
MSASRGKLVLTAVVALFLCALVILFSKPIFSGKALSAPDAPLSEIAFAQRDFPALAAGGWQTGQLGASYPLSNLTPRRLLLPVLTPEHYLLWGYVADNVQLYLATLLLLRILGVSWVTSLIGALAMAFSTHTFTLISAGHTSKSGMMPFAVLTFASLHLAITKRSLFWFALTGVAVGTGLAEHADVMFMFCLLAAAYGLFLFVRESLGAGFRSISVKTISGAVLAVVITVAVALPMMMFLVKQAKPDRMSNVQASGGDERENAWVFATNWSLPPEEILEFFVPGIFGLETGSPDAPYWGRTGQTLDWNRTHQGLRNLRQHGLYLGVLQLMFALTVTICALRKKCGDGNRPHILFWSGAWLVCVLLTLGRYGPLYRILYSGIPYASTFRCPIKFMHLVEVSTVVLFAFGLDRFLSFAAARPESGNTRKNTGTKTYSTESPAIAFIFAGMAILGMVIATLDKSQLFARLADMGFADSSTKLMMHLLGALLRSSFLFVVAGLVFWSARRWQGHPRLAGALPLIVALIVALDMVSAAFPYVRVENTSFMHTRNLLVDYLHGEQELSRVACPANDPLSQQLQTSLFPLFGIQTLGQLTDSSIEQALREYYASLERNPLRFWELGNAGYVFGPREALAPLIRRPAFQPALGIGLTLGADQQPQFVDAPLAQAPYLLLRNRSALPRALVYHNLEAVDGSTVLNRLAETNWNPGQTLLVEGLGDLRKITGGDPEPAKITEYKDTIVHVKAETRSEGVLLLNDRYNANWEVQVNGRNAQLLQCNGVMRGVRVPMGQVDVTFTYRRPYIVPVIIKCTALAGVLLWGLVICFLYLRPGGVRT